MTPTSLFSPSLGQNSFQENGFSYLFFLEFSYKRYGNLKIPLGGAAAREIMAVAPCLCLGSRNLFHGQCHEF